MVWGGHGEVLDDLGAILERSWCDLRPTWPEIGRLEAVLERSWGIWACLGQVWEGKVFRFSFENVIYLKERHFRSKSVSNSVQERAWDDLGAS